MTLDQMQGAIQVRTGFLVNGNPIGAGRREVGNEQVRVFDHQVAIEGQIGNFAQRLHKRRSHGEIGDKMPVHDIHMDDGATARGGGANLVRQMGEIGRQN